MKSAAIKSGPGLLALSAVTLATNDMAGALRFYEALGFALTTGEASDTFCSFALGNSFLNLIAEAHGSVGCWGRVIIHVTDVDAMYQKALDAGLAPMFEPRDATWGERYFHIKDPDGHELSFARPLP